MGRFASVLGPALLGVVALFGLAGCSSSKKATTPPSTTTVSSTIADTTTSESSSSTSSTVGAATTTTKPAATTTTVAVPVVFSNFSIVPASPVSCNAPTSVELTWTAVGVSSVDLAIDGKHFATFGGGRQDQLEYFACDGKSHTYALTAKVGTTQSVVTRVVTSKAPS